ncbi:hypothetical protein [Xanthomonas campestris]|uniref:hypothetical protein n=2 Tax=Xanthomonas campestris TaxID=339 RepID=UPI0023583C28|nr:hypothetical protein [Xanthomonas campestris]MEB1588924.1 hypothetical protein [Xanthomonas campestris pv. campestris]MDC8744690.1 hypothetical protein [Xanthomonas campestris]MEA9511856.1 hypothetical protein [Xanthomonas campestris]MEA9520988.1 hypothetical protein [Xanthomonas campestris]MEA9525314.1 hypothetical protein [Xanthomonas campestris]
MKALFYLPLSAESLSTFVETKAPFHEPIEATALFAALSHLRKPGPLAGLDRLIHEAFPLFQQDPGRGHQELLLAWARSGHLSVENVIEDLSDHEMTLASHELMSTRKWLSGDGGYSFEFQSFCSLRLKDFEISFQRTDIAYEEDADDNTPKPAPQRTVSRKGTRDQAVVANIVSSAPEERIAIDAYAGTGKTFLVHAIQDRLPGGFTYVAPSKAQIYGYQVAGNSSATSATLNSLVWNLMHQHARETGLAFVPSMGDAECSLTEQAQIAGISSIGNAAPNVVMQRLNIAIRAWCYSDDTSIHQRHFLRSGVRISNEMTAYIAAAERLWQAMFTASPRKGRVFELWHLQVAKWLVLCRAQPSASFGTLLVDEAHDLPPVWHSLFGAYQGGCILMGDPHQKLRGQINRPDRFQTTHMHTSLRIGVGADRVVEAALQLVPERRMAEFQSAGDHATRLRYYDQPNAMPPHGLRLYGNEWAMLAAALRLKAEKSPLSCLPTSLETLERSVRNALVLFSGRETWQGFQVNGCSDLNSLIQKFQQQNLQSIVRLFERGFDEADLADLVSYAKQHVTHALTLGLIDHAKNLEFGTVSLAPCCYEDSWKHRGFQPVHATYLGMTRARHELWLPGDSLDRLVDQAKKF